MKYFLITFSILIYLINNAQDLKVYHYKSGRESKISNEEKALVKLNDGKILYGRININSDTTLSSIQIDNVKISKKNVAYIQYSPNVKTLKALGIGTEIISSSLITGGIHIWNLIDPGGGFVSAIGYIISLALIGGGLALIPLGISLLQPTKVYGKKYLLKKVKIEDN